MRNLIIYDDDLWYTFLPLTYNKPLSHLTIGRQSIVDRWETGLDLKASYITQDHLAELFPIEIGHDNILVNGSIIPTPQLLRLVKRLRPNEALMDYNNELIVARLPEAQFNLLEDNKPIDELVGMPVQPELYIKINSFSDLLSLHENIIKLDASSLDTSDYHHDCFQLIGNPAQLFIHNTAQLEPCFLDTQNGPIIIESDVKILAGTSIKGPCVIGTDSLVKSNAVIYGPFSCGPKCVLAGELKSTIFQGYSNKGHFGYIGDSVIGAFCNLGGGTSASNVKNTLTTVHLWDYQEEKFIDTERMKLGMVLGDYSKTAIHTAFNTGTVIGLSCNIYSKGFPRKFIPSFSWGGSAGYINYELEKALEVASVTKSTKGEHMSENEKNMLAAVYKMSEKYRASYK